MVKLSVVVITFNEEKNLERCLRSVAEIADEILVVDSFSTDKTETIAMQFGARFLQHPFEGHIQQKNWAREQADNEYILSLDADESCDEELVQEILKLKSEGNPSPYLIKRKTFYCGHWVRFCGWYPDRKLRLWGKNSGVWGGHNPHDRFILSDSGLKPSFLKGNILHDSYHSVEEHYKQLFYFSKISARVLFESGKFPNPILLLIGPVWKFIRIYLIKLGFLDGLVGFRIAYISAYGVFLKHLYMFGFKFKKSET